jgi:predicted Zn-dependent protease
MRMDPMTTFRAIQLCWMGIARVQEQRFHEAITLLRQASTLLPEYPWTYPALAAACGHVGEAQYGREAISRFQTLQPATVEEWLSYILASPDHRELFLQGIALSKGQNGLEA